MLFMRGDILEAFSLNLNVIFSIGFLCVFPVLLGYDLITRKAITYKTFSLVDMLLIDKWVLGAFCVFELYVWIHNIIYHI